MMLFNSMTKEEAKALYDMCLKDSAENVVKIVMQDLKFFTRDFTQDYITTPHNEFLTDLIMEQNEQK